MGTVLYDVNEDATTDPITYYPTVVITGTLNTEDLAKLINDKEPSVSENDARACLNEFRSVCMDWLSWGIWVLLEDFVQIYTGLNVNFGQDYLASIQPEDLESLAYAQSKFIDDTEELITFDLNRYTFPKKPYVDSIQEKKYDTIGHIIGGYGCYVYGQDFGASIQDDETGVWLESPAGNNYQQTNNISFSNNTIIFVPDVTGELGAAGVNSVEHTLTVRGKYGDEVVVIGYDFLCRAENPVNTTNGENKILLSGSQTVAASIATHDYETSEAILIGFDGSNVSITELESGITGEPVPVTAEEHYTIYGESGKFIIISIDDLANIQANASLYNGAINDLADIKNTNPLLQFKTIAQGASGFNPRVDNNTNTVSWDLGNGDYIENTANISYDNYIDDSEKIVTVYNILSLDNLTIIDMGSDFITEMFSLSSLFSLFYISFQNNLIEEYNGGISDCVSLSGIFLNGNKFSQISINNIVDDCYQIRVELGSNGCNIDISGGTNSPPSADQIAKIEGTGDYLGDGLKDNGCTVAYNL